MHRASTDPLRARSRRAARAEPSVAARRGRQLVDPGGLELRHGDDHELSDPVASRDADRHLSVPDDHTSVPGDVHRPVECLAALGARHVGSVDLAHSSLGGPEHAVVLHLLQQVDRKSVV